MYGFNKSFTLTDERTHGPGCSIPMYRVKCHITLGYPGGPDYKFPLLVQPDHSLSFQHCDVYLKFFMIGTYLGRSFFCWLDRLKLFLLPRTPLLTLISDPSDPYKFCFYCPATHVTSQVLQPKSVHKHYRGRHTFISLYCDKRGS